MRGKTGGTRALCRGRSSYFTDYTFQRAGYGAARIQVVVVRMHRTANHAHRPPWMVFAQIAGHLTPRQARIKTTPPAIGRCFGGRVLERRYERYLVAGRT